MSKRPQRAILADRETRLRKIREIMRAHGIRISVTSGTRFVIDEIVRLSNLRRKLTKWDRE